MIQTVKKWDGKQTNLVLHGSFQDLYEKAKIKVDCIVTSPPYSTAGHRLPTSPGNAKNRQRTIDRKYDTCDDDFKPQDYVAWMNMCLHFNEGMTFWNVPPKLAQTSRAMATGEIIWRKKGGFIPFARRGVIYQHEYIFLFGDDSKFRKPIASVWDMIPQRKSKHPAPFPVDLPAKAIAHCTDKNDLVFDPFGGSGTTASVAKAMGRRWLTCDISEQYCEWMDERINKTTVL